MLQRRFCYFYLSGLLMALLATSCAQQGTPTGGPKDAAPPVMDTLHSTPNYRTQFTEKRIELTFNEWLKLKDVAQQVVISPPLNKNPQITLHGKTVRVDLGEENTLRPNTTYTINFGNAIVDLHESNAVKDLRFVFSTGNQIDSLLFKGRVVDALTGDGVDNATVMLYDSDNDSIITREKPYYFAKSNKEGLFQIQNIRAGTFMCVAIDEGTTPNLKWEATEKIGFLNKKIQLPDTTKRGQLLIRAAKVDPKQRLAVRETGGYGVVRLGYALKPDSIQVRPNGSIIPSKLQYESIADSILVWYDWAETPDSWSLLSGEKDTIRVKALDKLAFLNKHRLVIADEQPVIGGNRGSGQGGRGGQAGGRGGQPAAQPQQPAAPNTQPATAPKFKLPTIKSVVQNPTQHAVLPFNVPVSVFDTSKWVLMADSTPVRQFTVQPDSLSPRKLRLIVPWKMDAVYKLTLLPEAVTGFYGVANRDTIQRQFNVLGEKQLGGVILNLDLLTPGRAYVVRIMNGVTLESESTLVAKSAKEKLIFANLPVATYTIQLVEDNNANGRWDTADYFARRQPEMIYVKKLDALRANWELEATLEAKVDDGKGRQ